MKNVPAVIQIYEETKAERDLANAALAKLSANIKAATMAGADWSAISQMREERDLVRTHVDKLDSRLFRLEIARDRDLAKSS